MSRLDRLRRLELLAPPPRPGRAPSFDTTDPADPGFVRGEALGLVAWDHEGGHWTPVDGTAFRTLLRERMSR